ncbi:MAG: hypothetical protein ACE368_21585 [Paracoccaceae bacterium]
MELLDRLTSILGTPHVLTGPDTAPYATDWTGKYTGAPWPSSASRYRAGVGGHAPGA